MTHEYVIAVGGRVEPHRPRRGGVAPTAIGWAADRVLAVGSDDVVRSISRGDSTFIDLGGCAVTALPGDLARADALVRETSPEAGPQIDVGALLVDAGLLDHRSLLEPGAPADLAFWKTGSGLIAIVRHGAFADGDEHRGPFPDAAAIERGG